MNIINLFPLTIIKDKIKIDDDEKNLPFVSGISFIQSLKKVLCNI